MVPFRSAEASDDFYVPIVMEEYTTSSGITAPHGFDREVAAALPGLWYCLHLPNTIFELGDVPAPVLQASQALSLEHRILVLPVQAFDRRRVASQLIAAVPALAVVAEHVLGLGHRRVAVVVDRVLDDDARGLVSPARRRAATFAVTGERLAGYADPGLDLDAVPVFESAGNTVEAGRTAAAELLAAEDPPTALLCITDQLALGALLAAAEVPARLSVTGFDDLAEAAAHDLTTVHQDHVAKGGHAARLLLEPDADREVTLPTRLVVRGSASAWPAPAGPCAPPP